MKEGVTCPVCGLKFTETSRGISVDKQRYRDKCNMLLGCSNCGKSIGYLARDAAIQGRNAKIFLSHAQEG
jgi:hypothetical protein